jgi:hypothetical protein
VSSMACAIGHRPLGAYGFIWCNRARRLNRRTVYRIPHGQGVECPVAVRVGAVARATREAAILGCYQRSCHLVVLPASYGAAADVRPTQPCY